MPVKARELRPLEVGRLTAPGRHPVGGVAGLYLQVLPTGGRSWILRTVVGERRRDIGLGGYPDVTLAQAREAAREKRQAIVSGIDPVAQRKEARSALIAARAREVNFRSAAAAYIEANEASWKNAKHAQQWRNTIEFANAKLGDMLVPHIQMAHVLDVLRPIWTEKTETASRLRGRIELVIATGDKLAGIERPNPARWRHNLDTQLAKPAKLKKVEHHPALPVDQIGAFMQALRDQEGVGARALEFVALTAARSGEVRGAEWREIDLADRIWIVPAERMKMKKEHRVPLSEPAVRLLKVLKKSASGELVFQAPRGGQLSDMTLTAVIRRMNDGKNPMPWVSRSGAQVVPHGFRSTFRDWAAERSNHPHEVAEMALAHAVGDEVERAYRRGDLLEKRYALMQDWADFCAKPATKAKVIALKRARAAR